MTGALLKAEKDKKIQYLTDIIICVIILFGSLWGIKEFGHIYIVGDEFGYWGIAATWAGYDWSDMLSVTDFYSFGYSIVLFPIMLLTRLGLAMDMAYKLAIVVNAIMLVAAYWMICYVIRNIWPSIQTYTVQAMAAFAVLYIGNTSRVRQCWSEICCFFAFWLVVVLFTAFMSKRNTATLVALIIAAVWLFSIHMRTIGVVTALCVAVFIYVWNHRNEISKRTLITGIITTAVMCLIWYLTKKYVSNSIYGAATNSEAVINNSNNDISNQVERTLRILSVRGIADLVLSVIGKFYYQAVSTFMMAAVGFFAGIAAVVRGIRSKTCDSDTSMSLFMVMGFSAELLICGIYQIFRCIEGYTGGAADAVVYGRYVDFCVGLPVIIGIVCIYKKYAYNRFVYLAAIILTAIGTVTVQWQFNLLDYYNGGVRIRWTGAPWLSKWYDSSAYFCLFMSLMALVVFCVIILLRDNLKTVRKKIQYGIPAVLGLLAVYSLVVGACDGMDYYQAKAGKKIKTVDSVADIIEAADPENGIRLARSAGSSVTTDISILQWELKNRTINFINEEELGSADDLSDTVFLCDDDDLRSLEALRQCMTYVYDSGTISVFWNNVFPVSDELQEAVSDAAKTPAVNRGSIELRDAVTYYSYVKYNHELYYNYQGTDGAYLTEYMPADLEAGVYRFDIDMKVTGADPGQDIGYITVGTGPGYVEQNDTESDVSEEDKDTTDVSEMETESEESAFTVIGHSEDAEAVDVQQIYDISGDYFAENGHRTISVYLETNGEDVPFVGIYTYGNSAIKIYDISYEQTESVGK